jgi:hypothetical protein
MTPIERVAAWADEKPAPTPAVKSSSTRFDLPGFIARHGLRVRKEKSADGFMLYELEVCPFNADHKGGSAYITQTPDGKPGFHCHHSSCADKDWRKMRAFLDPDYQKRSNQRASNRTTQSAPSDEALDILCQSARTSEPQRGRGTSDAGSLISRCVSDIEAKPINWLWPGRIARGKLTIIAGNPGLGKSQITASIAAVATTGDAGPWTARDARRVTYSS